MFFKKTFLINFLVYIYTGWAIEKVIATFITRLVDLKKKHSNTSTWIFKETSCWPSFEYTMCLINTMLRHNFDF